MKDNQKSYKEFWDKEQKKVREKSRECHNHKPQPFPDPKPKWYKEFWYKEQLQLV